MSLRFRLLLVLAATVAAGIAVVTVVAGATAERLVLDEIDHSVLVAARAPETPAWNGDGPPGPRGPGAGGMAGAPGGPGGAGGTSDDATPELATSFVRIEADGRISHATAAGPADAPYPLPAVGQLRVPEGPWLLDRPLTVSADGRPDLHYRAVAVRAQGDAVVVVAQPIDRAYADIARVRFIGLGAAGVAFAAAAAVAWFGIGRALRPLAAVEQAVDRLAGGDFAVRAEVADPDDEVGRLAASVNVMADRIDSAFQARAAAEDQLRRFVADASHELRTPLTSIVGYTDLHAAGALGEEGATDRAMARIGAEALRLTRLVEDLLLLARLDQRHAPEVEPVDLDLLLREVAEDARAAAPDRPVAVDAAAGLVVPGDPGQLRQVFTNLLANARVHTPPGTPITVTAGPSAPADPAAAAVAETATGVMVTVADQGPGLDAEAATQVFERFWRGDAGRSRDTGGAGLGLPIVAAIVAAHGGRIDLDTAPGQGCRFRVWLPSA